jgi:hypothetical protein
VRSATRPFSAGVGGEGFLSGASEAAARPAQVIVLDDGRPASVPGGALVTASFRETLGSRYVELVIGVPGRDVSTTPVRSGGMTTRFRTSSGTFVLQVLAIDWSRLSVQAVIAPAALD